MIFPASLLCLRNLTTLFCGTSSLKYNKANTEGNNSSDPLSIFKAQGKRVIGISGSSQLKTGEAYLYLMRLNDTTYKVGCHQGTEKALCARYGTVVCEEHLADRILVPVEPRNRFSFERALHSLLQRHSNLHKEKEKYTLKVKSWFQVYANYFRLCDDQVKKLAAL